MRFVCALAAALVIGATTGAAAQGCPPGTRPIPETDNCERIGPPRVKPARVGSRLVGVWMQTQSSGGPCPTCTLTISAAGDALSVRSSNGWSARVVAGSDGDTGRATGSGRWVSGGGQFNGRPLTLDLDISGPNQLQMTLGIRNQDGSVTPVQASFVRRNS